MRIGFDAKRLFRNYTGLGNYSRTLVANLRQHFVDNEYILFAEKTSDNAESIDFLSDKYVVAQRERKSIFWRSLCVCRDIKRRNIDIYHGLSHDLPFGIAKTGAKSVVTIHDVCYKTFPAMFPLIERLIYSVKYKYSCRVADRIVAISQSTKSDIVRYFGVDPSRVEVIYQAINSQFYELMAIDEAWRTVAKYGVHSDFILYVGSINSRKNLIGVIRALALLDPSERLPLVVIGGGSGRYRQSCLDEAERLDVSRYVHIVEGLSLMRTLQAFYRTAKCLVYPSFYEGFGLPVAEAILSCCPVVTSNVSSLPEAGGSAALYVDPNDFEAIKEGVRSLLHLSEAQREELTQKGRAEALVKFDAATLTSQVEKLYQQILQ